jgi:hypothetical protein
MSPQRKQFMLIDAFLLLADIASRPAYTPFGDGNPYSNYPGYPYATYYPEPAPPPPPFYQPITITVTSTQEQTTVYVTDEQTYTSTITDLITLTTETVLMPETVTATEFVPDPNPTPTDPGLDPGLDPGPVIITVTQYDPAPTGDPNAPFDPNAPPVDPNQPPIDPNQPPIDPNQPPPFDPNAPVNQPPIDPNQPSAFDPNAPAPTAPADFTPTPIADPTQFVPGADAPLETDQPVFDPGPGGPRGPTVVIPPALQSPSTCGPNNPCAQTADYYCDPQPLCSQGQNCPGLCFPKFGGQYSQPDDIRQAAWDKAMKEGVYRVQLTVREVRTVVKRDAWVTVVGNVTGSAVGM